MDLYTPSLPTSLSNLVNVGTYVVALVFIVPHIVDILVESCRCGYVMALMFLVVHPGDLFSESCRWVCSGINVA